MKRCFYPALLVTVALLGVLIGCIVPTMTPPPSQLPTPTTSPLTSGGGFVEYVPIKTMEVNQMDFSGAVVNGIPLLVVIVGLVEFAKKFGLKGNGNIALSMGLGVVFGVLYQLSTVGIPVDLSDYFGVALYGLVLGLTSCGLYDVAGRFGPH